MWSNPINGPYREPIGWDDEPDAETEAEKKRQDEERRAYYYEESEGSPW
jgi:hypothetical protein